jgi:hypothetical protein
MVRTNIPNEFQKYWHPEFAEWHSYKIGEYHVSSVGISHQHLEPNEHSGPCLRATFYEYINPIEKSDETEGNFEQGSDMHKLLQDIVKKWKPNTIIEKPLIILIIKPDGRIIKVMGSEDIHYIHQPVVPAFVRISIWDIKTASEYTLPPDRKTKNPTHFDQTYIYAVIDEEYFLHPDKTKIVRLKIIYIDKHNKGVYVQRIKYNPKRGKKKLEEFKQRVIYLDDCLIKEELPDREPHHWCKYCVYQNRCRADVIYDKDIPKYTEKELKIMYEEETGKNAMYKNDNTKETKGFIEWKKKVS